MYHNQYSQPPLPRRQRGMSLVKVALVSGLLAGVAMVGLMSMRGERNLFAEGAAKVQGAVMDNAVVDAARQNMPGAQLRKCVINGKTVVSNTDCKDDNPSTRAMKIQVTRGVEAPKVPVPAAEPVGSNSVLDKIIEKQVQ